MQSRFLFSTKKVIGSTTHIFLHKFFGNVIMKKLTNGLIISKVSEEPAPSCAENININYRVNTGELLAHLSSANGKDSGFSNTVYSKKSELSLFQLYIVFVTKK